jgi:hypothetical protein
MQLTHSLKAAWFQPLRLSRFETGSSLRFQMQLVPLRGGALGAAAVRRQGVVPQVVHRRVLQDHHPGRGRFEGCGFQG